jgi:hypothetical protein
VRACPPGAIAAPGGAHKIADAVGEAIRMPDVASRIKASLADAAGTTSEQMAELIRPAADAAAQLRRPAPAVRAGQPCELHLFSGADHFMFAKGNTRVWGVLRDWLRDYFPVRRPTRRQSRREKLNLSPLGRG